jgi:hypothetical protein
MTIKFPCLVHCFPCYAVRCAQKATLPSTYVLALLENVFEARACKEQAKKKESIGSDTILEHSVNVKIAARGSPPLRWFGRAAPWCDFFSRVVKIFMIGRNGRIEDSRNQNPDFFGAQVQNPRQRSI